MNDRKYEVVTQGGTTYTFDTLDRAIDFVRGEIERYSAHTPFGEAVGHEFVISVTDFFQPCG